VTQLNVKGRFSQMAVNLEKAKKLQIVTEDISEDLGLSGIFTMRFLDLAMERDYQRNFVERRLTIGKPATLGFAVLAILGFVLHLSQDDSSPTWFRRCGYLALAVGFLLMYLMLKTVHPSYASFIYDPFMLSLNALIVFMASMTYDRTAVHFNYDRDHKWAHVPLQEADGSALVAMVIASTALVARPRLSWMFWYFVVSIAIATFCPLHYGSLEYDLMSQASPIELWSHGYTVIVRNFHLAVIAVVAYVAVYHQERRDRISFAALYLTSLRLKAQEVRAQWREHRAKVLERRAGLSSFHSLVSDASSSFGRTVDKSVAPLLTEDSPTRVNVSPSSWSESRPVQYYASLHVIMDVDDEGNELIRALQEVIGDQTRRDFSTLRPMIFEANSSLVQFHEALRATCPELLLFALDGHEEPALSERTMCMVNILVWLTRCDTEGRMSFCCGVDTNLSPYDQFALHGSDSRSKVERTKSFPSANKRMEREHYNYQASDQELHQIFLEEMDWSLCDNLKVYSGCIGDGPEKVDALICLIILWNLLSSKALKPTVLREQSPFKEIDAGLVISSPGAVLDFLVAHFPRILPCYAALGAKDQAWVRKVLELEEFKFASFVHAEGPPGALLGDLKEAFSDPQEIGMYLFFWVVEHASRESSLLQGASKFTERYPPHLFADILNAIPFLVQLATKTETEVMEAYVTSCWTRIDGHEQQAASLGEGEIVACRNLVLMAQHNIEAAYAFGMLQDADKEVLKRELSRTGAKGQQFTEIQSILGGPAFVLRDSSIFLQQHTASSRRDIFMALRVLSNVYRAARLLWPSEESNCNRCGVIIWMSAMRTVDASALVSPPHGTLWLLVRHDDRSAQLQQIRAGEINGLAAQGVKFQVLDFSSMVEHGEMQGEEAPRPAIHGKWKCVETFGLDEFLKSMGVGKLQRMAAGKAPWPSWSFVQDGDHVTFTNKTAMGDLRETFIVDGPEYTMVDGYKREINSKASWENDALVIMRHGPEGRFLEERKINGDKLYFRIAKIDEKGAEIADAPQWGRVFERSS